MDHSKISIFSVLTHLLSLISISYLDFYLHFLQIYKYKETVEVSKVIIRKKIFPQNTFNTSENFVNKPTSPKT